MRKRENMKYIVNFLKGVVVGIGGVAPGLSGSVLLIILGLYEKVIGAVGTLFKNFKKNILFLVPLVLGFGVGVLLFSKFVEYMLLWHEFVTRYLFLGLVLGTIPLFYKEVRKRGFHKKYYAVVAAATILGVLLFFGNASWFPVVQEASRWQSVLLGVAVAGSSIVPGVDSAVILSALGLYELYVGALANVNLQILLPAGLGLALGAVLISGGMYILLKRFYTGTFSLIFGLFLSIIPRILTSACALSSIGDGALAFVLVLFGFLISFYLGDMQGNTRRIRKLFRTEA